jgi:hypothetical protein
MRSLLASIAKQFIKNRRGDAASSLVRVCLALERGWVASFRVLSLVTTFISHAHAIKQPYQLVAKLSKHRLCKFQVVVYFILCDGYVINQSHMSKTEASKHTTRNSRGYFCNSACFTVLRHAFIVVYFENEK